MAFPQTVNTAAPAGADSPRLGDNEIRALKQLLADLFTLPTTPSQISATIGSVSTAGKFTLTNALWNADAIEVAYGGTAFASYTIGDLLQASASGTLAKLAAVATGKALISGGVGVVSSWGKVGLATHVSGNLPVANLNSGTSAGATTFWRGDETWGTPVVSLTENVSGILPTANGGTGIAYFTAAGPTAARIYTFPDAASTISTAGLQEVWIDAASMTPRVTNGPSRGYTEQATNKGNHETLDFDTTTQEFAQFKWGMPKSWNEGTVTFVPYWTAASSSGTAEFALQAVVTSNDDALDVAMGTEQTSNDTLISTSDCHIGPASSAITIAGTPATNDMVTFQVKRNPASDSLGADAKLLGILLRITISATNDA